MQARRTTSRRESAPRRSMARTNASASGATVSAATTRPGARPPERDARQAYERRFGEPGRRGGAPGQRERLLVEERVEEDEGKRDREPRRGDAPTRSREGRARQGPGEREHGHVLPEPARDERERAGPERHRPRAVPARPVAREARDEVRGGPLVVAHGYLQHALLAPSLRPSHDSAPARGVRPARGTGGAARQPCPACKKPAFTRKKSVRKNQPTERVGRARPRTPRPHPRLLAGASRAPCADD